MCVANGDNRKTIYTTNAIESLSSIIRAAIMKRKVVPTDDLVRKVIYLAIKDASKKWSMPIRQPKRDVQTPHAPHSHLVPDYPYSRHTTGASPYADPDNEHGYPRTWRITCALRICR